MGLLETGRWVKFNKSESGSVAVFEFEFDNGAKASIRGMEKLKRPECVYNRLSEALGIRIATPDGCEPGSKLWDRVIDTLMAAMVSEPPVKPWEDESTVREWITELVAKCGVFGAESWDLSHKEQRPLAEGEWLWFYPSRIAKKKDLSGQPSYEFYATLSRLGVEQKSKKIDGKVHKAYRLKWQDFFDGFDEMVSLFEGGKATYDDSK